MIEIESISKKATKIDYHPCPDLLSEFPLSIIHVILARVPIRDAIRTSVLSRQWRYTWASLPHLVFDQKFTNREDEPRSELAECMKNIITRVLFLHEGPIHKFKMSVFFATSWPDMNEWILCLSRNDIKEIIIDVGNPGFPLLQQLRSSLYSCEKLTNLDLWNCELDPPPSTFKGFLFLKRLSLDDVELSTAGVETLVANAPLLERFVLSNLRQYGSSELSISAPNLKHMCLHGGYTEICMYAPLLAEMSVLLSYDRFTAPHQQQKRSVCNYTNFLSGLTNLEKLSGYSYFAKYLSIGIEFCHHSLVFHHLKDIELDDVNFEDIKGISVVLRLIMGAPNLHKLKISTNLGIRVDVDGDDIVVASDSEAPEVRLTDFGWEPGFTFEKLRVVVMEDVSGFPSEVEFMEFLLASSPVLETMSVSHISTLGTEAKERLADELLGCFWASPNAELMVPSDLQSDDLSGEDDAS